MSKYCANCGKEIREDAMFCPSCGTKVQDNPTNNGATNTSLANVAVKTKKSGLKVAIGAIIVIIVAVAGCIFGIKKIATPAYEKPIKKLETAYNKGSFADMKEAISTGLYEEIIGDRELSSEDMKSLGDNIKEIMKDEYGEDYNFEISVVEKTKIPEAELKDTLNNDYYIPSADVEAATAAYDLKVKIDISYKSDSDTEYQRESEEDNIVVIKENGKWKISDIPSSMW